jgi:hypothetical protein
MRKIIESISYCCLLSSEIRIGHVPRQIKYAWNADEIFVFLSQRNLLRLPDFARLELTQPGENPADPSIWQLNIQGSTEAELERLLEIYRQCHRFLHEINPYSSSPLRDNEFNEIMSQSYLNLQKDHMWIWNRFWQHSVRLDGELLVVNFGENKVDVPPSLIRTEGVSIGQELSFSPIEWRRVIEDEPSDRDPSA